MTILKYLCITLIFKDLVLELYFKTNAVFIAD